jgi:hypothetical protein
MAKGVQNTIDMTRVEATIRRIVVEETNALMTELLGRIKLQIREKGAIAWGNLVASFDISVDAGQAGSPAVKIASPLEYGAYVEFGTKPHWPPLEPLYRWVEKKLSVINWEGDKPLAKPQYPFGKERTFSRARQIYNIARAIQRKIAAKGSKGRFFMRDAIVSLGLKYEVVVEAANREMVYRIDVAEYLDRANFWSRVEQETGV